MAAGLCGLVTSAMYVTGVVMTMEVMVSPLPLLLVQKLDSLYYTSSFNYLSCSFCEVVLFRSREHANCGPQPGFVRAHLESKFSIYLYCWLHYHQSSDVQYYVLQSCLGGGFNIAPLKPRNGRPRTQVQHLIQIDLKGWGAGYLPAFQQHCLLQMLNSVSGTFLCALIFTEIHVENDFCSSLNRTCICHS